jgi:methylase of polypeptide subunit release factors
MAEARGSNPLSSTIFMKQLRSIFDRAGYTVAAIAGRLGLDQNLTLRMAEVPIHLRRLTSNDQLDDLIRLFFLNSTLPFEQAEAALHPVEIDELVASGILEQGRPVRSALRFVPRGGLLFAFDGHDPQGLRTDSVLGWTSSARTLASMTVRRPVQTALDLGTGCGLQALLAASHAKKVVAVDLNPRALWLTELNCRLNGITNVECREGDLFEPVRGESFDLVVTNPPFVISPSSQYLFRDAGMEGDALSRAAVTGAAEVLNEGGFAHVMCNWISNRRDPWWLPPSRWVEGSGCDTLLFHYDTLDPLPYAAAWNDYIASDASRLGDTLDEWLGYYRDRGIEALGMGAVVLRRRSGGENWFKTVELARGPMGDSSRHLERIFSAEDHHRSLVDPAQTLAATFRPVEGHRLEQILTFRDGAYSAQDAGIVLTNGIGVRNRVPPQALHVLLRLDGSRQLGDLVEETAEETGLDSEALASVVMESVQELFGLGLLELE